MGKKAKHSRIRAALAQFCCSKDIELEELYDAIGVEIDEVDDEALAHLAGLVDGMQIAQKRIRKHGLDNWAKDI